MDCLQFGKFRIQVPGKLPQTPRNVTPPALQFGAAQQVFPQQTPAIQTGPGRDVFEQNRKRPH